MERAVVITALAFPEIATCRIQHPEAIQQAQLVRPETNHQEMAAVAVRVVVVQLVAQPVQLVATARQIAVNMSATAATQDLPQLAA